MKALIGLLLCAGFLAGCSQTESAPEPVDTGTVSEAPASESPTPEPSTPVAATSPTVKPSKSPEQPKAADTTFCAYLKKTSGAAQQVEDPTQFVALVEGARAVAPGAIEEDLALYAESVRKLALTVTGSPAQAARADAWLADNEDVISAAEANVNNYSLSVCGQPFITGEGQ